MVFALGAVGANVLRGWFYLDPLLISLLTGQRAIVQIVVFFILFLGLWLAMGLVVVASRSGALLYPLWVWQPYCWFSIQ